MHLVDGGSERMRRRIVDVIDVVITCNDAGRPRGVATASHRNGLLLYRRKLRNGDDEHDGRRGRLSLL
jgi:hypothetical protein